MAAKGDFKPLSERYEVVESGCWMWRGAINTHGYAHFMINNKDITANRYFYEFYHSTRVPSTHQLYHLCRQKRCVNPNHLEVVTRQENSKRYRHRKPLSERYYVSETGCWMWTGAISSAGYPHFSVSGKTISATRYFYEFYNSTKIPEEQHLDHRCPHTRCVNPKHLEPVSPRENTLRCEYAPATINANKTECIRGHPLSGDNLYMTPDGRRQCRTCRGMSQRKNNTAR